MLVEFKRNGEWQQGLALNPIMENAGDCGLSGQELRRRYCADRIAAEVHLQFVLDNRTRRGEPPMPESLRIVSVLEDALMTTLYGFEYPAPTVGEWLEAKGFTTDTFPLIAFEDCQRICAPKSPAAKKYAQHITDGYEICNNCGYTIRRGQLVNDDGPDGLICGRRCKELGPEPTAKVIMDNEP